MSVSVSELGRPWVLASLVVACTVGESMESAQPKPQDPTVHVEAEPLPGEVVDGPEWFFAVLGQTGIEHCPDGTHEPTWLAVQPTLGSVPAGDEAAVEQLMDRPVLARGTAIAAPPRAPLPVEPQPCPMAQMRSDWIDTPRGIRVQRTLSPDIEHFEVSSLRELDELAVRRDGDELVAEFSNPLPFALTGVRLRMHYEGCYGKPGTTSRESEPVELAPGQTITHRFPQIAEHDHTGPRKGGPTAHEHIAAALVLELPAQAGPDGGAVHADLSVSLHALGLAFECE